MRHFVVAVKQVPDTTNIRIDPETGSLIRKGVPSILNPYDAHAMAVAGAWKQKMDAKITVISMGPASNEASIRECFEMGADRGILISAREFAGADTLATSYVLWEVLKKIHAEEAIDVIFMGKQAIDGDTGQVGPQVGARLGWPTLTFVNEIVSMDDEQGLAVIRRTTEQYRETVEVKMPMLLTCQKEVAPIPYASLPMLMDAMTKEIEVWGFGDPVAFEREKVGLKGSPTKVFRSFTPELKQMGEVLPVEMALKEKVTTAFNKVNLEKLLGVKA
jgi:electron transfer flavoprotein beta subunit